MLNDYQLEIAARRLCDLRGVDPDKQMCHGATSRDDGMTNLIAYYSPRWCLVAQEIRDFEALTESMNFAINFSSTL